MKINTVNPLVGLARYELWKSGWAEKDKVDEFSYISNMCNPEDVLLSSKIFFPDFVVAKEGVFLENKYDYEIFSCWFKQFDGDLQATEKMINHTHLYDVFDGCSEDIDDSVFEQLAEVVALSWRLVLSNKFPERKFNVEVSNSDQDYGPVVTFYEII
ncbi:hypothetical protein HKK55_26365 [Pseudomonas sp. ADAK18]|uniref:hypothetical protein n=1 Tax=Pseudomonas sp. ADAK18 TaxID=2730848 RepID=UPI001463C2B8|nr:hypothetical protein [Pseudomonas sp. ADAK18]QJI32078.1 hypothetical protein HKK55_26365 [Pseudomonas sp. ADAK18]